MKHLTLALIMVFVLTLVALSQPGGKQPLPNFVGNPETTATNIFGKGWGLGKFSGGVQGVRSAMLKGPHDFTSDSGKYVAEVEFDSATSTYDTTWHPTGGNKRLCSYCHSIHITKDGGIAVPLWNRASQAGKTFGKYVNPISLDATVYDAGTTTAGFKDNYSSFCLGCHDGSVGIFAPTAYSGGGGVSGDVSVVPGAAVLSPTTGHFSDMEHTHPVNFDYNAVQALVPEELYPAVDPVSAVWKGYSGANGSGGNYTTVRLFNGTMQCSSCHNPHMSSGIGTVLSSDYGRRCVACHKK
ncbi:MAG: hypothetical protein EPO24_16200 [Bacteroidetes bacterium]|nr:MAG: hypothetical protein EPO24_16200 [Bacteroidota bacterium]